MRDMGFNIIGKPHDYSMRITMEINRNDPKIPTSGHQQANGIFAALDSKFQHTQALRMSSRYGVACVDMSFPATNEAMSSGSSNQTDSNRPIIVNHEVTPAATAIGHKIPKRIVVLEVNGVRQHEALRGADYNVPADELRNHAGQ